MTQYKLSKLQVTNFRNLSSDIVSFCPGINCIIGENGNGKTNILEAIHVLLTAKSFKKNTSFPQYLSMDGEKPEIIFSSVFTKNDEDISYCAKLSEGKNNWFSNGKLIKKRLPINVVFINPFDSYSFHTVPSARRQWFDHHIGMIDRPYKKDLSRYKSLLRFRNSLLSKKPDKFKEQIRAIDSEIAPVSISIIKRRQKFLTEIRDYFAEIFQSIFSEEHNLEVVLESKFSNLDEEKIFYALQANMQKEAIVGHTLNGVHKDDYTLLFDGLNSYEFCSLGQQKISYLSLLFAYINLFRYKFNTFPLVLIDDVSGELDQFRWKRLVNYLKERDFQVLITTANDKFKEELEKIDSAKKIKVISGSIFEDFS